MHVDKGMVTVNCLLSPLQASRKCGGSKHTCTLSDTIDFSASAKLGDANASFARGMPFIVDRRVRVANAFPMDQGECLFHAASASHGAFPTLFGTRYVAIFFWDLGLDVDKLQQAHG
jgi:hypothetical protein